MGLDGGHAASSDRPQLIWRFAAAIDRAVPLAWSARTPGAAGLVVILDRPRCVNPLGVRAEVATIE
jgi:hypothetical protein